VTRLNVTLVVAVQLGRLAEDESSQPHGSALVTMISAFPIYEEDISNHQ
jgi:hypothetical protein